MKRIRKVVVHITEKREEVKPIIDISPIISTTVRPFSVLSGPDGDFEHALKWAKDNGTRLFTRAEAQYLFEHSENFRESVKGTWFWVLESASVYSNVRSNAWQFNGASGYVGNVNRNLSDGVRCVGGE